MKQRSSLVTTRSHDVDHVKGSEHSTGLLATTNNNDSASPRSNEIAAKVGRGVGARGTTGSSSRGGDVQKRAKRDTTDAHRGKDSADEHDDGGVGMRDRETIDKANKIDMRRLSLSGSRTHLSQLKPKSSRRLPQRGERESSNSDVVDHNAKSNHSDDNEGNKTEDGASIFADDAINSSNTGPHPKASPFRTMLARGVGNSKSSSAAALALKDKFGRSKAERLGDENRDEKGPRGGMGTLRFRLGMASRRGRSSKNIGSRPPVQHSDSIDSDEEERVRRGGASWDASDATSASSTGGNQGVPPTGERGGGRGGADDEHEYFTGSNSSDEEHMKGDHDPRGIRGRRGRSGKAATGANADNFKSHLRRLRPTSRTLRWLNNKKSGNLGSKQERLSKKGGQRSSSPAAAASSLVPSDSSSSAAGSDFDRHEAASVDSAGSQAASAPTTDKTSLLGRSNKLRNANMLSGGHARDVLARTERGGGGGGGGRGGRGGDSKRAGTSLGADIKAITRGGGRAGFNEDGPAEVAPSSGSGIGRWLTPWRWRFRSLEEEERDVRSGKNGARFAVVPVSGAGRPAVGAAENVLYGWFGGVVGGRTWPGVGLANCPVFDVGKETGTKMRPRLRLGKAFLEDDVIRVHVVGTDALPEDSRITRPMIVVHVVDSSTGKYLSKTPPPKGWPPTPDHGAAVGDPVLSSNGGERSPARSPDVSPRRRRGRGGTADAGSSRWRGARFDGEQEPPTAMTAERSPVGDGATTTFEGRTRWDLANASKSAHGMATSDSGGPETGIPCETVPPVATQPWLMTMRSSTPVWDESVVFSESYRSLLGRETLVLFELVDFAASLSRKEARKGGGLSKIAWGFLRPIGGDGECNVGIRRGEGGGSRSSHNAPVAEKQGHGRRLSREGDGRDEGDRGSGLRCDIARRSTLQLFEHQPLSLLARWQARWRGFPRRLPPITPEVPDVFLQYLLIGRKRYPATLEVSVGPTPRPRPVWVMRRPMAPQEHERHQLSYEALAAMHEKSQDDREKDEAAGLLSVGGAGTGAGTASAARVERAWAARTRRLRDKNEACALPDRLLHRVYAGQNGAITLAFSGSGSLLAAACCDDPLPGSFPIRLIDTETGRCRHELREHASMVYSLVWSPGDLLLLSASADGTAKVWCIASGSDGDGHGEATQYNKLLMSAGEGLPTSTRRGSKDDPWLMCVLQHAPPCFVYAAVFQPAAFESSRAATTALDAPPAGLEASEYALVVTGAYDRRLRLWDISAAGAPPGRRVEMLGTLSSKVVHESHVNAIVYDAKNGRLYSGDGVGVIVVWRRGGGGRGADAYSVLRKVQHADLTGKAITSLALAPRRRRGQLLVQAHGNTLRLLDLATYQLVNPGFAGGGVAGSLVRASFSPDGRFVVSGSEKGRVRVWEAQEGKRVKTPLQTLGTACCLRDVAWHPHQHVLALAGYGQDSPVLLYAGEATAGKQAKGEFEALHSSPSVLEEAANEAQASAVEHRRRLDNKQRLRELRIKRLRAKALGCLDDGNPTNDSQRPGSGVAAALAALTSKDGANSSNGDLKNGGA